MKTALTIVSVLIVLSIAFLLILGKYSQKGQAPGLVNGSLSRCSEKPNCVCSEYKEDVDHYIEAIYIEPVDIKPKDIQNSVSHDMTKIMSTIKDMKGVVQIEKDNYIAATFTSSVFGFVDDFEIRIDPGQGAESETFHFRSASRVGYSDGGVNKKRVELFKQLYKKK